jgi:hypothetical protein
VHTGNARWVRACAWGHGRRCHVRGRSLVDVRRGRRWSRGCSTACGCWQGSSCTTASTWQPAIHAAQPPPPPPRPLPPTYSTHNAACAAPHAQLSDHRAFLLHQTPQLVMSNIGAHIHPQPHKHPSRDFNSTAVALQSTPACHWSACNVGEDLWPQPAHRCTLTFCQRNTTYLLVSSTHHAVPASQNICSITTARRGAPPCGDA